MIISRISLSYLERLGSTCRALPKLCLLALVAIGLVGVSGCSHKKDKVRVVTIVFETHAATNEGRPFTVVVQENQGFMAGPPGYDEVVQAASAGKPYLAKGTLYPGHDTEVKLVGVPAGTQVIVSSLFTEPPDSWQQLVNLGKREKFTMQVSRTGLQ